MPISQNTYTVPNNFVQQYDLGQKKIRADLVDENFTDAAGAINTLLTDDANTVHLTGAETISGAKTFTSAITASGGVTGNVTGNCSGSSGSCTGNASTATALQTARTINGVSFDGTANITVADSTKVALNGSNTASIGSTLSTYMAHAAMPSGQYIDLTLPASGGTVTAPADGWITFVIVGQASGGADAYILMKNKALYGGSFTLGYALCWGFVPCSKNDVISIEYRNLVSTTYFRFYYANGNAPTV